MMISFIPVDLQTDLRHAGQLPAPFGAQPEQLFVQVLMLAREKGMLKLGKMSVDGSKTKANASKHSALSWGHLKKIEQQLRKEIQQLLALAESEDRKKVPDGMDVPQQIARREEPCRTRGRQTQAEGARSRARCSGAGGIRSEASSQADAGSVGAAAGAVWPGIPFRCRYRLLQRRQCRGLRTDLYHPFDRREARTAP